MGVKYGVADSSNLISAMRNNVASARTIIDRLNSGSQHLISHLDAGLLDGAAYTAGRGLFGELIVPAIAKLGEAIDDIQAELASYEHAHSVVAEHGDLDEDDLTAALATAEEQLRLTEDQLERNRDFLTQVQAFFTGELPGLALQNQALERLKEQLEHTIRELKTTIEKLEWFVADVSNYFSDSLEVMQLAAQAAIELNKVAVEADGTYYTNGVDLALIRALNGAKVTTHESSIETLIELYGFTEEEAAKVLLAMDLYFKSGRTDEHEFLAMMAALCDSYRATRWTLTAGTGSLTDAKDYFAELGLTARDVEALVAAVNRQHADASSSGRKDFAHEMVGLAIFTAPRGATPAGFMDFVLAGQLNEFSSYKGDVASNRFGRDDMQSDTDMINIYQRSVKSGATVLQAMSDYNSELASGDTNRAQELADHLGGGDFGQLTSALTKEVESYNLGDEEMSDYLHLTAGYLGSFGYSPLLADGYATLTKAYEGFKTDNLNSYLDFLKAELSR